MCADKAPAKTPANDLKAAIEAMKKDAVVMGDEVKFTLEKWLRLLKALGEEQSDQ